MARVLSQWCVQWPWSKCLVTCTMAIEHSGVTCKNGHGQSAQWNVQCSVTDLYNSHDQSAQWLTCTMAIECSVICTMAIECSVMCTMAMVRVLSDWLVHWPWSEYTVTCTMVMIRVLSQWLKLRAELSDTLVETGQKSVEKGNLNAMACFCMSDSDWVTGCTVVVSVACVGKSVCTCFAQAYF